MRWLRAALPSGRQALSGRSFSEAGVSLRDFAFQSEGFHCIAPCYAGSIALSWDMHLGDWRGQVSQPTEPQEQIIGT